MHKVSRVVFKYDKAMMLQWSAHRFMTIYHAGMCYIWIEWSFIPRQMNLLISLLHYLNKIVQYIKLTVRVRYSNQVMSPYIQKIENVNESIMLLFFQWSWPMPFLLFHTFLGCIFFSQSIPPPSSFSSLWVTLGMMLYDLPYVNITDSACGP